MARPIGYSLIADAYDFSDFPAALDEAEALGVDFVELPLFALHLVADGRIADDRVARLERLLRGRRLRWSAHGFLDVNPMAAEAELPRHEAVARAMVAIAGRLGCRHVVFHAGRLPPCSADEAEAARRRQRDMLARLGDTVAAAGVIAVVENVFAYDGLTTPTPSALAADLIAVDHPAVAACLDVGHAAIAAAEAGLDVGAEVAALAPLARHVHVHDNFGRPRSRAFFHPSEALAFGEGDLHLAPGDGALPLDRLLGGLRADAWLNLELSALRWPDLASAVDRLRRLAHVTDSHVGEI